MLAAEPDDFARTLAEIDAELRGRIADLRALRRRLGELGSPERLALPPVAAAMIERFREAGFTPRMLTTERDSAVLMAALFPDDLAYLVEWRLTTFDDPDYRQLMFDFEEARGWDPDDPRLADLADRSVAALLRLYPPDRVDDDANLITANAERYQLVNSFGTADAPAWRRLNELVDERIRDAGYPVPS